MTNKENLNSKEISDMMNEKIKALGLTDSEVIKFFMSQYLAPLSVAEKRLLQFLHLGTIGQKITFDLIKGVKQISIPEDNVVIDDKETRNLKLKYLKEIEEYNRIVDKKNQLLKDFSQKWNKEKIRLKEISTNLITITLHDLFRMDSKYEILHSLDENIKKSQSDLCHAIQNIYKTITQFDDTIKNLTKMDNTRKKRYNTIEDEKTRLQKELEAVKKELYK